MSKRTIAASALLISFAAAATVLAQVTDTASSTESAQASSSTATSTETLEPQSQTAQQEQGVFSTTTAQTTSLVESSSTPQALATASGIQIAQEIAALEAAYFGQTGKYLQVLKGNQLPDYETGTIAEKFGTTIREDASIDVYQSPTGLGYQIKFTDGNTFYSFGYGPEWVERTYSYVLPDTAASSTP